MKRIISATNLKNFTYGRFEQLKKGILQNLKSELSGETWDSWEDTTCLVFPKRNISISKIRLWVKHYAEAHGYAAEFYTSSGAVAKSTTSELVVSIPNSRNIDPYASIIITVDTDNSENGKVFIDFTFEYVE